MRRRDAIEFVKIEDGNWVSSIEEIGGCFVNFFEKLFKSSNPHFREEMQNLIQPSITSEDNEELTRMPSEGEIKETIFSMGSLKAPGPDGMPPLFFKH